MAQAIKYTKQKIGFIGIGKMGSRMSKRILDAGHTLTVYDRTQKNVQVLVKQGAAAAESPRKLAAGCDIVMSSVTNDAAIEAVMFGPEGALAGAGKELFLLT